MKRLLLTAAAVLAVSQAGAADLIAPGYQTKAAPAPYVASFSWTGLYVGGDLGYGWAAHSFDFLGTDPNSQTFFAQLGNPGSLDQTTKGVTGGPHAGYNMQFGSFVLGAEFEFDWSNMQSSAARQAAANGMQATVGSGVRVDWYGTANARLGWSPSPNWLISAVGGFAFGNISDNAAVTCVVGCGVVGFSNGSSNTHTGWDAGAEVQWALSQNIIAGLRYRYVDLGNTSLFVTTGGAAPMTFNGDTSARFNEFSLTLDYRF